MNRGEGVAAAAAGGGDRLPKAQIAARLFQEVFVSIQTQRYFTNSSLTYISLRNSTRVSKISYLKNKIKHRYRAQYISSPNKTMLLDYDCHSQKRLWGKSEIQIGILGRNVQNTSFPRVFSLINFPI